MLPNLTPQNGLIFRITHIANLPWLLANGLHCASSGATDPNFVAIGNPDLINKRTTRTVPHAPGGTLADYVPFYFTPRSPMLLNIRTGYSGVTRRPNEEIVVLVSSSQAMRAAGVAMLYTDRHAYIQMASWTAVEADLARLLDWDILRRADFRRDEAYPDKMERYQAEALAHRHAPPNALIGIGCASGAVEPAVRQTVENAGLPIRVVVRQEWYFT